MSSFFRRGSTESQDIDSKENAVLAIAARDKAIEEKEIAESNQVTVENCKEEIKDIKSETDSFKNSAISSKNQVQNNVSSTNLNRLNAESNQQDSELLKVEAETLETTFKNIYATDEDVTGLATLSYDYNTGELHLGLPKGLDLEVDPSEIEDKYKIGEYLEFYGDLSEITYNGEWHDTTISKVFNISEYPDFVPLNPDELENTGVYQFVLAGNNTSIETVYPEAIKMYDDMLYSIQPYVTGSYNQINGLYFTDGQPVGSSITAPYYRAFQNSWYWKTVGIDSDDGNGYIGVSSSYDRRFYSLFPVDGVTLSDGTLIDNAILCTITDKRVDSVFAISAFSADNYAPDMSDFSMTNNETMRNECNNLSNGNLNVAQVLYREDGFYIFEKDMTDVKKYSYDFTGGTLKEIAKVGVYTNLINSTLPWRYRLTAIGDETENIYQIDTTNGDIYINGVKEATLKLSNDSDIDNIGENENNATEWGLYDSGVGSYDFLVKESEGKIFISFHFVYGSKCYFGALHFNGSSWSNSYLPYPLSVSGNSGVSMNITKLDMTIDLMVIAVRDQHGTGNSSNSNNRILHSFDMGINWEDTDIGSLDSEVIPFGKSSNRIRRYSAIEEQSDSYADPFSLSSISMFGEGNMFVDIGLASRTKRKFAYIPKQYKDTLTFEGVDNNSKFNRIYVRVK